MKEIRLMSILLGPVISEKSTRLAEGNRQVIFKVVKSATKQEVKDAVEMLFDVKVESVNVVTTKGKTKRFGRFTGTRSDGKKAYVTLREGSAIEFATA